MSIFKDDLLDGKVALVTGGGSGIGEGIAKALAAHGARIALCGRTLEKLERVAKDITDTTTGSPDETLPIACDVRQPDQVQAVMAAVKERFGRLDILVNNAAGNFLQPAASLTPNGFGSVIDIDLKGTFNVSRAAFPLLLAQGGNIVNISATLQYAGTPLQAHAVSAKAGIDALTRTLAVEWGPSRIRVNAVAPGPIGDTEGMRRLAPPGDIKAKLEKHIPLGRFGTVAEIGDAVLYLVSPAASYVNGAILVVDGGAWLANGFTSFY